MTTLEKKIWNIIDTIPDPEIPNLSITDLGMVREVVATNDKEVLVWVSPTYSGCPATDFIMVNIKATLQENGFECTVKQRLFPAWTTDWITERGHQKLKEAGIAAPVKESADKTALFADPIQPQCPRCDSQNTILVSQFGSTACKAQYKCDDCLEPFDYFKCH